MSDNQKVKDVVQLIKRLQTFDMAEMIEGVQAIPPGIVEIRVKDWKKRGVTYQTVKVSLLDEKALRELDPAKYEEVVSPEALKAGLLLQKKMSFDPNVLYKAKAYLPEGMLEMSVGARKLPPIGINININEKRLRDVCWPVTLDEIEPVDIT